MSTSTGSTPTRRSRTRKTPAEGVGGGERYSLPVIGATLPPGLVEKGFWGALVGSAVLGAVDPPLAVLLGAGVLVARHRRR